MPKTPYKKNNRTSKIPVIKVKKSGIPDISGTTLSHAKEIIDNFYSKDKRISIQKKRHNNEIYDSKKNKRI